MKKPFIQQILIYISIFLALWSMITLALAGAGNAKSNSSLQPAATLTVSDGKLGGRPIAQVFAMMQILAEKTMESGTRIKIIRSTVKNGECDTYEQNELKFCPREILLVSIWDDKLENSIYTLLYISPRYSWGIVDNDDNKTIINNNDDVVFNLISCEASINVESGSEPESALDHLHGVPYRLRIVNLDRIEFYRLPDRDINRPCSAK